MGITATGTRTNTGRTDNEQENGVVVKHTFFDVGAFVLGCALDRGGADGADLFQNANGVLFERELAFPNLRMSNEDYCSVHAGKENQRVFDLRDRCLGDIRGQRLAVKTK